MKSALVRYVSPYRKRVVFVPHQIDQGISCCPPPSSQAIQRYPLSTLGIISALQIRLFHLMCLKTRWVISNLVLQVVLEYALGRLGQD